MRFQDIMVPITPNEPNNKGEMNCPGDAKDIGGTLKSTIKFKPFRNATIGIPLRWCFNVESTSWANNGKIHSPSMENIKRRNLPPKKQAK